MNTHARGVRRQDDPSRRAEVMGHSVAISTATRPGTARTLPQTIQSARVRPATTGERLRRGRRIIVALLLAAIVALLGVLVMPRPPSLATTATGDRALIARARPLLVAAGERDRVSVARIDGDTVTYANFGATDTTTYEIGSISKTFTAALLADAIARGEVTAATKVGTLLPLSGSAVADVTLAELASHRSGLPRQTAQLQDELPGELRWLIGRDPFIQDVDGVIAIARTATLHHRGGSSYSNLGVALLGQALAAAAHRDYARLIEERILTPLGMTASSVPVTVGNLPANAPTGYNAAGRSQAPWTLNGWAPAGGIRSTPADMVRYAQAVLDGTAPGMGALTPRWTFGRGKQSIGYAWITQKLDGRTITWHDGETGGFASMICLDRAAHRAVIILSNTAAPMENAAFTLLK